MLAIVCMILQGLLMCHVACGINSSCQLLHNDVVDEGDMPLMLLDYSYDSTHAMHDDVTLVCKFENYCSIAWYRNGVALDTLSDLNTTYRLGQDNQSVTIDDVMAGHQGIYECVGSNGTSTESHKTYLRVQGVDISDLAIYDAKVTETSQHNGQRLWLFCYTMNYVNITWYRDGNLILQDDERVIFQNEDQVLIIKELTASDSGFYRCVASNGTHTDSREGEVHVKHACNDNEILLRGCSPSTDVIEAPLGSNLTIECIYSLGMNMAGFRFSWYRFNGTEEDEMNDTFFYVAPSSDESDNEGTDYRVVFNNTGEENPNCTDQLFWSASLVITNVTEGTYGYYIIFGYRNWDVEYRVKQIVPAILQPVSPVVRSTPVYFAVGCLLVLLIFGSVVWRQYQLDMKLFFKEMREYISMNDCPKQDGCLYDVYVACCDADATLVLHNIMPALKETGYSTCLRITDILPGRSSHDEIWHCMKASRSCLLILSDRQLCQDNIGHVEVQAAVSILRDSIVPVLLEPVMKTKIKQYPVFKYLLKTNPKLLCRKRDLAHSREFKRSSVFKGIRLGLPTPSERRKCRAIAYMGYLDDEFRLIDDESSNSSDGDPFCDRETGGEPPEIVVTTRAQCYHQRETV